MCASRTQQKAKRALTCSLCGSIDGMVSKYHSGYVCNSCSDVNRQGRDATTVALRAKQQADRAGRSLVAREEGLTATTEQLEYIQAAGTLIADDTLGAEVNCVQLAGRELASTGVEPMKLVSTVVALEASIERVQLVSSLGNDIAALALDTANAVGATSSVEQILAHQLATAHHQAMNLVNRSAVEPDAERQLQLSALAAKWMAATNNAALTLKKLKASGEQRITIQHVNVEGGGQAVIGAVRTGGVK